MHSFFYEIKFRVRTRQVIWLHYTFEASWKTGVKIIQGEEWKVENNSNQKMIEHIETAAYV